MRLPIAQPVIPTHRHVNAHIQALLIELVADADDRWGGGDITPSAYEAAWVAMVRDPYAAGRLAFPESLAWLLCAQQRDGSWLPAFPFSLLPTLAALLALCKAPVQNAAVRAARARAKTYLEQTLDRWPAAARDTPFIEFLVPVLISELARHGICLAVPQSEDMERRRDEKLARLPLDLLYTSESPLVHALEAVGPLLDYEQLRRAQAPNGCYGYSPSATAAVLIYGPHWDEAAARWLRHVSDCAFGGVHGAMPASHPADTFEIAWILHLLLHGDVRLTPASNTALRHLLHCLYRALTPAGATFGRIHALPCDADDTAVVLTVLNRLGVQTPLDPLWAFEHDHHFVSYAGERAASTSANAHALEAMLSVDALGISAHAARREKVIAYVLGERRAEAFWRDKWHVSPYYATLSCVLALAHTPDLWLHRTLAPTQSWLLNTQRRDGGWGTDTSTLEESAYALLTLRALHSESARTQRSIVRQALQRGQRYLWRHWMELGRSDLLPPLWVDKTLYAPPRVIRAAVLAALHAAVW